MYYTFRHMLLKYGTGNPRNKKSVKQKDPKARIEELKRMYRDAAIAPTKKNEGMWIIFGFPL